jgi:hypothetical protein
MRSLFDLALHLWSMLKLKHGTGGSGTLTSPNSTYFRSPPRSECLSITSITDLPPRYHKCLHAGSWKGRKLPTYLLTFLQACTDETSKEPRKHVLPSCTCSQGKIRSRHDHPSGEPHLLVDCLGETRRALPWPMSVFARSKTMISCSMRRMRRASWTDWAYWDMC